MAHIRLASVYDTANHIGTVYTMTVQAKEGYPQLTWEEKDEDGTVIAKHELLQPTKKIVFGHKHYNGDLKFKKWPKVTDEQYRVVYLGIVEAQMHLIIAWYKSLTDKDVLTLCCYCYKGKFCHRQFVAKLFIWLNNKLGLNHTIELC